MKFFADGRDIKARIHLGLIVCDDPSIAVGDSFSLVASNGSSNTVSAYVDAVDVDGQIVLAAASNPVVN